MTEATTTTGSMTIGIDLGDRFSLKHKYAVPFTQHAARTGWAPTLGLLFLTATVAVAQTNYQWIQVQSGGGQPIYGIAAAPTTPATVLSARTHALNRSIDAGASWSRPNYNWRPTDGEMAFDPVNPDVVYAACWHGLIKSTDRGANWFDLPRIHAGATTAVVIDPSNTSVVYAGVRSGWGVYKSTNGGSTWTNPLRSHDVQALAINPANPQILFAGTKDYSNQGGGVLRSVDGGQTWTLVWPNAQINAVAVDPVNPQVVYAGASAGGVFKSTDGGFIWTLSGALPNSPVSVVIVDPTATSRVYAATAGSGVYLSTNSGATWTSIYAASLDPNCLCMALHSSSRALFVGTYSGSVYVGVPLTFPSSATPFGLGCGSPALTLSPVVNARPIINTTARASLTNIPSVYAVVMLGWSNTSVGPFPLPLSLAPWGMLGCDMLQSADASHLLTPTGAGTATYSERLPNWVGLIGLHIYLQGWAHAPGANPANVIVSNGVEWVIGNT